MKKKCIKFLEDNGWEKIHEDKEMMSFTAGMSKINVDITDKEIVFIDDTGDFLNLPLNLYALIGALFHYRQISVNYKYDFSKE